MKSLPHNIPEALQFDTLSVFRGNPKDFNDASLSADDLWETGLNGILKTMLGWGKEGNMDQIMHRGKWGLDGLVDFVAYFIEECVSARGCLEESWTT